MVCLEAQDWSAGDAGRDAARSVVRRPWGRLLPGLLALGLSLDVSAGPAAAAVASLPDVAVPGGASRDGGVRLAQVQPPPPPPPPPPPAPPAAPPAVPPSLLVPSPLSRPILPGIGSGIDLPPFPGRGDLSPALGDTATEVADATTVAGARAALAYVESLSSALERRVVACENALRRTKNRANYIDCIGSALEEYGAALNARIDQIPPPLRAVVRSIPAVARQVRAARTIREARAAVRTVVTQVRKAIQLLRADDPAVGRLQVRTGNTIASALKTVENSLARAEGL